MYLWINKISEDEMIINNQEEIEVIWIEDSYKSNPESSLIIRSSNSKAALDDQSENFQSESKIPCEIISIDNDSNQDILKRQESKQSTRGIWINFNQKKNNLLKKNNKENVNILKRNEKQFEKFINELKNINKTVLEPENKKFQESSEWCICLELPKETKCKPWNCDHLFWYSWLKGWVNVTNICPLCKISFKFIVKLSENGAEECREEVKEKKPDIEQIHFNTIDQSCYVCCRDDNEGQLLICDYWDSRVWHTYCDGLDVIPESDWFWSAWRRNERGYDSLREMNSNISEAPEQPVSEDDEEIKQQESENDEEYDPKSKKFQSLMNEREESRYMINKRNEIFNYQIQFDDDNDDNEENEVAIYTNRYNTRNGSSRRYSRSSSYIPPKRKWNKSKKEEINKPSKYPQKKRNKKMRIKRLDESESENWEETLKTSKLEKNRDQEELKRQTRSNTRKVTNETNKVQESKALKRLSKNNCESNSDCEEISKIHSSQVESLIGSTNENEEGSSSKSHKNQSQKQLKNIKPLSTPQFINNIPSRHNIPHSQKLKFSQITVKSSSSNSLHPNTQNWQIYSKLSSYEYKPSTYHKKSPLLMPASNNSSLNHSSSNSSKVNSLWVDNSKSIWNTESNNQERMKKSMRIEDKKKKSQESAKRKSFI